MSGSLNGFLHKTFLISESEIIKLGVVKVIEVLVISIVSLRDY
jgi:hypothetical protein